jgi:anthranilate phosphoribosyltransferase
MLEDRFSSLLKPEKFFQEQDQLSDDELLAFVRKWHQRGEEASEIKAFLDYISVLQKPPLTAPFPCIDCAGTGGDRANTFNISTAAAIIASACKDLSGAPRLYISKNGGRSTTSNSGSVDVLEALGFKIDSDEEANLERLREYHLAFFSSKITGVLLGRVKKLSKSRKETCFISLIGPLISPVAIDGQVLGVGRKAWLDVLSELMQSLIRESKRKVALLVHSSNGQELDELSSATEAAVIEIGPNDKMHNLSLKPEDIGLQRSSIQELAGGKNHEENAQIIKNLLSGSLKGPKLETACLNAALILYLAEKILKPNTVTNQSNFVESMRQFYGYALEAVSSGKAEANCKALLYNKKNYETF